MSTRTSSRTVTFKRPFALSGTEALPAGTYTVETEEEQLDVSFPAYRRTATSMFVPGASGGPARQMLTVDPLELAAALEKDAADSPPDRA